MKYSPYWPRTRVVKSLNNAFTAAQRGDRQIQWSHDRALNGHNAKIGADATKQAGQRYPKARVQQ
jgi:hypothetical protein